MREALLLQAQQLAARFPWLGIGPDLGALTVAELWGVCRFLQRMSAGG